MTSLRRISAIWRGRRTSVSKVGAGENRGKCGAERENVVEEGWVLVAGGAEAGRGSEAMAVP